MVLTLLTFRRVRRRNATLRAAGARPLGAPPPRPLLERLVPDPVLINTFPRMNLVIEYMDLTGLDRIWIRVSARVEHGPAVAGSPDRPAVAGSPNRTATGGRATL